MQKERGLTLIELMITLAIAALLVTLAGPSFKRLIQSNAMSSTVNTFLADLRFARSEAIKRGTSVVMCRADNPEAATPTCETVAGTKGWASGWVVFEENVTVNGTFDSGERILRVQSSPGNLDKILEGSPIGTSATLFRFTGTGRLLATSQTAQLTFGSAANYATSVQRVVCVSSGGRARIMGDGTTTCGTAF